MLGLILSGVTAFPLPAEVRLLTSWVAGPGATPDQFTGLARFILSTRDALDTTERLAPTLFYGTDWLAFGHLVIALAFIGPLRDPVRNIWVVEWAMICCAAVPLLALICGPIRGIPFAWQLIDCSFGAVGIIPLWICRRLILRLAAITDPAR